MILFLGIFCLSLYTERVLAVEIADGDSRVERAIFGGGERNNLLEAVGGGFPGKDFPVLNTVPKTNFDCHGLLPGYYADENYGCQVFHICHTDQRRDSFLCPNGTIFHQVKLVCDWWYNVDCASTDLHFDVNLEFGKPSSNFGGGSRTKVVQPAVISQSTSFQDSSNQAQLEGSRLSSQPSQFGTSGGSHFTPSRGSSAGEQDTQFGRGSEASHFSGNVNDLSSQTMSFGISKIEQPNFNQFDLDRDKQVLSQTSFHSAPSRSQNHHQSSFQTNFNSQVSPVRTRQDSSRAGVNQFGNHRQAVKEVKINKRPVSLSGIPFPSPLPRQSVANLAERSGRVLPKPFQTEADPTPTTFSPRAHNFQVPNSIISPPRKEETSARSSHGTFDSSKVHNKPINGKVSSVKKVTVNKRPIASVSNVGGKQDVRILDDSRAANQFFNLGTPIQVTPRASFGRPLPKPDVQLKKTVTKTQANVESQQSNFGRPLPPVNNNVNNFGRPAPRVQATTHRSTIRSQNLNNIGVPLPPPQSNIISNAVLINHVQSNVAQQFPASRAQGQTNNFGRHLPSVGNKNSVSNARTSPRNNNRGSVTFSTSQLGGNRGAHVTRTRLPTVTVNEPNTFTVLVDDDDDIDDLNDPFDDDRFDDDRFDEDRFDDDRFDDDRFDDDKFDDDRFDDDRFKVKVRSKFDDDRFDNDPFDDDRFDFDDDDDDDDNLDDRRNRFDNAGNFNFGRRPRGSTSSLLVAHKGNSNDGQAKIVAITPPPEIQLPPPLLLIK